MMSEPSQRCAPESLVLGGPRCCSSKSFTPPEPLSSKGPGAGDPRIGRVHRRDGARRRLPPAAAARLRARLRLRRRARNHRCRRRAKGPAAGHTRDRMSGANGWLHEPTRCRRPLGLVAVPDALDSAQAAALPLDLVTAALAVDLADPPSGATIFVQGVSGAVGALITQAADRRRDAGDRHRVGSHAGLRRIAGRPAWWTIGIRPGRSGFGSWCPSGADAAIDHTGGPLVRTVVTPKGTVVRTAWSGRSGHGRMDAALGGFVANIRRYARPRERLCSVPLVVALQPGKYRKLLHDQLNRIVDGRLRGPTVTTFPFADVVDAHRDLATLAPGHKLVLEMDRGLGRQNSSLASSSSVLLRAGAVAGSVPRRADATG